MKRLHVHVGVENLDASIRFYGGLFGAPPSVRKSDYANWMVDDPRVNFAISQRGGRVGVNHLGLQAESAGELEAIRAQFAAADSAVVDEPAASCRYARSDKHWVFDPQGLAREGYRSMGEIRHFDHDAPDARDTPDANRCCPPSATLAHACCEAEPASATTARWRVTGTHPQEQPSRAPIVVR